MKHLLLAITLCLSVSGCPAPTPRDQIIDRGPANQQPVIVSQAELLGVDYYARNGNTEVISWYSNDDRANTARIAKFVSEGWHTEGSYGHGSLTIYMARTK